jgi:hypothetical protein
MSTASKTPNLGLMNPVGSDDFDVTDFSTTFGIIDTVPGILTVPNQASRPTGWGAAQNGRRVWQADQNIEWVWSQPSSGVGGVWLRTFPKGWLGGVSGGSASTGSVTLGSGPVVLSQTVLVPGGRPIMILVGQAACINETTGTTALSLWQNGSLIGYKYFLGRQASSPQTNSISGMSYWPLNPAPATQLSVNYQVQLNAWINLPSNAGISSVSACTMDIYEM